MSNEITAVTNQKGGVGKTTTTVNLGVALAMLGKKVLLVDGDPQGSLTISMGYRDPDKLTATLSTVMMAEIEDRSIPPNFGIIHHAEGIDLLPGNIELSGVELSLVNAMSREQVLRSVLDRLRSQYDHILIDCMPSLGLMNINALAAADSVIIPLQPNYLSTKGLNLLLRSIARVRKQINPKLRIAGILFTMVDSRTNNAKSIISSLHTAVGNSIRIFKSEIPRSVRAAEAAENGKSNRISLFSAQWGKCAVTGQEFYCVEDIHCHHKVPKHLGGTDAYANLVLVLEPVHRLIHATTEATIRKYLDLSNLSEKQLAKVNQLREQAGCKAL